jgi:purine nucleoside phosphorylase
MGQVESPFGTPSDQVLTGRSGVSRWLPAAPRARACAFADLVPYRANIDALKRLGVTDVMSVSACGSFREEMAPGDFVIVDQFIDRTFAREKSFFGEGLRGPCLGRAPDLPLLGDACEAAARPAITHARGGTYLCMEGPQFSTLAESKLYREVWGCDVIGMTNMPEAKLAREAELCYATVAMVTDYDSWHPGHGEVDIAEIVAILTGNADKARSMVACLPGLLGGTRAPCPHGCDRALDTAILTAPEKRDRAVYAARATGAPALLLSAVGIEADTPFARWRREGEAVAGAAGVTILRPGLVLGETSYGGSSLARALSALPLAMPVVGDGEQVFNPIHARDLAKVVVACVESPPPPGPQEIGGPERITQAGLLALFRAWMGLAPVPVVCLHLPMARGLGAVGDALRLGPVSRTSVAQLAHGVEADEAALTRRLGVTPDGVSTFVTARPAGTQDLWHARLYLLRPVLRLVLALLWLASGLIGLFLPSAAFLPLVADSGLPNALWIALARLGGVLDLVLAGLLLRKWRPRVTGMLQLGLVGAYTLAFTVIAPALWLLPLGGLLKNLAILFLILVWMVLEDER